MLAPTAGGADLASRIRAEARPLFAADACARCNILPRIGAAGLRAFERSRGNRARTEVQRAVGIHDHLRHIRRGDENGRVELLDLIPVSATSAQQATPRAIGRANERLRTSGRVTSSSSGQTQWRNSTRNFRFGIPGPIQYKPSRRSLIPQVAFFPPGISYMKRREAETTPPEVGSPGEAASASGRKTAKSSGTASNRNRPGIPAR